LLYSSKFNVYFLNWNRTLPICHCCTSFHFHGWCHYLSCKLWKTLHFQNWTFVLPVVLPTLIFPYFPLYDCIIFSHNLWFSVLPWILTHVLLKLRPRTSHCHCVYFLHLRRWFHYFPFNLRESHTSKIKHLYFSVSIHVLATLIHLYLPLVDFIIFLALHVEHVLPKTKHLYFYCYRMYFPESVSVLTCFCGRFCYICNT
jgi:hypothetical protein